MTKDKVEKYCVKEKNALRKPTSSKGFPASHNGFCGVCSVFISSLDPVWGNCSLCGFDVCHNCLKDHDDHVNEIEFLVSIQFKTVEEFDGPKKELCEIFNAYLKELLSLISIKDLVRLLSSVLNGRMNYESLADRLNTLNCLPPEGKVWNKQTVEMLFFKCQEYIIVLSDIDKLINDEISDDDLQMGKQRLLDIFDAPCLHESCYQVNPQDKKVMDLSHLMTVYGNKGEEKGANWSLKRNDTSACSQKSVPHFSVGPLAYRRKRQEFDFEYNEEIECMMATYFYDDDVDQEMLEALEENYYTLYKERERKKRIILEAKFEDKGVAYLQGLSDRSVTERVIREKLKPLLRYFPKMEEFYQLNLKDEDGEDGGGGGENKNSASSFISLFVKEAELIHQIDSFEPPEQNEDEARNDVIKLLHAMQLPLDCLKSPNRGGGNVPKKN